MILFEGILNTRWYQDIIFQVISSTGSSDTARRYIVMQVKCLKLLFEHNQYILHVGNVCGGQVWSLGKIHFLEEENRTRKYTAVHVIC